MKKILFLIFISIELFATNHSYSIPHEQLDAKILAQYFPQIWEEIGTDFNFQENSRTCRLTKEYGYSFFKMKQNDFSYLPPPLFLQEIGAHICKALGHEPVEFTNIILSYYEKGFYLEPHIDINKNDPKQDCQFYFDENVYGIIIEPDSTGHLYFVEWHGQSHPPLDLEPVYSLPEKAGLVFCLQNELRGAPFFHGVSKVSDHRISITFRTVTKVNAS